MSTLVATADPTTGTVRIDVEQTQVRDLFTRVVANGWGNATTGQAWTTVGGVAADFSVNGTQGLMTFSAAGASRRTRVTTTPGADMGVMAQVTIAVAALTAPIEPGMFVRYNDVSNHYLMNVSLAPSGVATLNINKIVLNVITNLASIPLEQVHVAGATWLMALEVCGHTVRAKAWRSTVTEPGWILTVTDFDLNVGTNSGFRSLLASGNTNGSTVFAYDNFVAWISQPVKLFRVTPDGARTEVRGSPGFTEDPTAAAASAVATFYDNEVPFDVNVFYEMTSNCATTVIATSNTVNLASGGDGWLRDPVDPTRNLRIVMDDLFDECVDEDVIVYSGIGGRNYANASGIFDVVDDRRPVTVSQTRKNYGSVLTLTSYSLDDIDGIEDIMDPGRILLLSLPVVYGFGHRSYGTDYVTFYDVDDALIGVDQRVSTRVWTMPFRLSYEPADTSEGGTGGNGIGGGGATYEILAASALGTTYNTLTASGETYLQVAQGVGY